MTYQEFVEERIQCDPDDREPFCPFNSPNCMGYCNTAYSESCYCCEESLCEYAMRYYGRGPEVMDEIFDKFDYTDGMTHDECVEATDKCMKEMETWEVPNENLA